MVNALKKKKTSSLKLQYELLCILLIFLLSSWNFRCDICVKKTSCDTFIVPSSGFYDRRPAREFNLPVRKRYTCAVNSHPTVDNLFISSSVCMCIGVNFHFVFTGDDSICKKTEHWEDRDNTIYPHEFNHLSGCARVSGFCNTVQFIQ